MNVQERIVSLTLDLVRAKSENPPGNEELVADIIEARLKNYLQFERIKVSEGRPNLVFGTGKEIVFNGHMDTVPIGSGWVHNPTGEVINGKIYGRGSSDMKGALASIIISIEDLIDAGNKDILKKCKFAFVADEESGGKYGTKAILEKIKSKYGVVMEGSVNNGVVFIRPGVRGSLWIELVSHGKSAHASNPAGGLNAVLNLAEVLVSLKNINFKFKKHTYLPDPTMSIGTTITGGEKVNIIPDYAKASLDIRVLPSQVKEEIIKAIEVVIQAQKYKNPTLNIDLNIIGENPAAEIPLDSRIIEIAKKAGKDVLNYEPAITGGSGSNDSAYMIKRGIETISFGPGDFLNDNAHGKDESVSIATLVQMQKIYRRMIENA
jgi:acetylornithine deacetylase/succinyl-diaminopimelate desuccinylase family protein